MKTASDPRHIRRVKLMQALYTASFRQRPSVLIKDIWGNLVLIDSLIVKSAPQWPLSRINPIDLAILRLATWELVIDKTAPIRVIIDESVELAHEFGSDHSSGFINGVLGNIVKNMQKRTAIIQFLANEWQREPYSITSDIILSDMGNAQDLLAKLQDALDLTAPEGWESSINNVGELLEAFDPQLEIDE